MVSLILFLVAIGSFYFAFLQFRSAKQWHAKAKECKGEIIRIESGIPGQEIGGTRKLINVFPVVKFSDNVGQIYQAKTRTAILRSKVKTGQSLDILYDPDNPDDVRIGRQTDLSLSLFLTGLGLIFMVIAISSLFF